VTFGYAYFLWFLPIAPIVLAIMLLGDLHRRNAAKKLGEASLVDGLVTFDAGPRRAIKGALRVLAVVLAILAVARPRYGRGTKIIPAADVSAVVALDLSKSMYAQDVLPSRLERARSDVSRMITDLPQIRWGAVAFAGEAIGYPPTSDVGETAQFLRAHEPYEMPGGTAIAKALEVARRQLVPQELETEGDAQKQQKEQPARRSKRVVVLVTDGEDLEGDPVEVARECKDDGIVIHVVMVGARAPQPIPDVDPETGVAHGYIRDESGQLVTTELSPAAEDQLKSIATETQGIFVRSEDGTTGVAKIEAALKSMIASEGGERVETLYADQYAWPLGFALALLIVDAFIGEAPRRRRRAAEPEMVAAVAVGGGRHAR
jgi:Ca-activated chloride channel family protein